MKIDTIKAHWGLVTLTDREGTTRMRHFSVFDLVTVLDHRHGTCSPFQPPRLETGICESNQLIPCQSNGIPWITSGVIDFSGLEAIMIDTSNECPSNKYLDSPTQRAVNEDFFSVTMHSIKSFLFAT